MTLRLRNVQVDVPADRYDAAAAFWAGALGATTRPGTGPYTHLVGPRGAVGLHLQRLEGGDARYHLDLEAADVDAEVARALELGAAEAPGGDLATTLTDPAGMPFCICPAGAVTEELRSAGADEARLHLVVLDVPSEQLDATTAFWSDLFGVESRIAGATFPAFTFLGGIPGPDGDVGLLVQDIGADATARIHLDLHVGGPSARDAEVARLERLGAERIGAHGHWLVLAAPGGHLFCVVPDRKDDE